jgi:hypothetical protein
MRALPWSAIRQKDAARVAIPVALPLGRKDYGVLAAAQLINQAAA